jgi:hypothetical protein
MSVEYALKRLWPTIKMGSDAPEKKTRTGEVDGAVACLLLQSFDAHIPPGKSLGKITVQFIAKSIEPTLKKPFPRHKLRNYLEETVMVGNLAT